MCWFDLRRIETRREEVVEGILGLFDRVSSDIAGIEYDYREAVLSIAMKG